MKLLGRTTRPEDLARCAELLRDGFLYDDSERVALRTLWHDVLERDVGRSAVVFDAARPERVLAFGISAAISEARFDAIVARRAPFIAKSLLDEWRRGDDPFLDESSFASANANGGLHVIVLHNGVDESLDVRLFPDVLAALSENFMTQHAGSNMRVLVHEGFGIPREFAVDTGFRIVPYAAAYGGELAALPSDRKPLILTMTRDDAARHPGNLAMNQMFLRVTPPRCRLALAERRLLRYALEGMPDDTIAAILQIAPRTLKKRWARVYAEMEPVTGIAPGGEGGGRGAEVRRHVLRYLRQHPEELHAFAAPKRSPLSPSTA